MEHLSFLEGINKKKEEAWKSLYRFYYAPLCSYVEKMTGDAGEAEDIVQECLIRMWHTHLNFTELKALTAWLYKSVYHAAVSVLRTKKTGYRLSEYWNAKQIDDEEHACKMALQEEAISRFYEILDKMPRQQRDILIYSLRGLTVQQIAAELQISENSVKTHKKRAYLFVRHHYDSTLLQVLLVYFRGTRNRTTYPEASVKRR
ncbi:sigma-70 family RNA polymerase sigma factor [Odoribacter sp. N15.MGS-14]|uniref:RNA polymerase sigma factor n=1 Tax=Odoribacter sp. N15.MGS-14 TaxID=1637502 RepID=UPI000623A0AF|nr:sigma-70 family RNA polymerase sigma factor [Odoribacter sp. N15.MGS-14]